MSPGGDESVKYQHGYAYFFHGPCWSNDGFPFPCRRIVMDGLADVYPEFSVGDCSWQKDYPTVVFGPSHVGVDDDAGYFRDVAPVLFLHPVGNAFGGGDVDIVAHSPDPRPLRVKHPFPAFSVASVILTSPGDFGAGAGHLLLVPVIWTSNASPICWL